MLSESADDGEPTYELSAHAGPNSTALGALLATDGVHDCPDEPAKRLESVDDSDGVVAAQVVHALGEQAVQVRPRAARVGRQGLFTKKQKIVKIISIAG